MKKQLLTVGLIMLFTVLALCACAVPQTKTKGNKNVVKEERNVSTFTGIDVGSAFKVYLKQGKPQSLAIEIDENYIDAVVTKVSGNTLNISTTGNIDNPTQMNVYITVEKLSSLDISGAAILYFETPFDAGEKMEIDISGAAKINDATIKANIMEIDASGASKIDFTVSCSTLEIDASGASNVNLKGTANSKKIEASGAAKINVENIKSKESKLSASGAAKITTAKGEMVEISTSGAASIQTVDR